MTRTLKIELPLPDDLDDDEAAELAARARVQWLAWGVLHLSNAGGGSLMDPLGITYSPPAWRDVHGIEFSQPYPLPPAVSSYIQHLKAQAEGRSETHGE